MLPIDPPYNTQHPSHFSSESTPLPPSLPFLPMPKRRRRSRRSPSRSPSPAYSRAPVRARREPLTPAEVAEPIPSIASLFLERDDATRRERESRNRVLRLVRSLIHDRMGMRLIETNRSGKRGYDVTIARQDIECTNPPTDLEAITEALQKEVAHRKEIVTCEIVEGTEEGDVFVFTFMEA